MFWILILFQKMKNFQNVFKTLLGALCTLLKISADQILGTLTLVGHQGAPEHLGMEPWSLSSNVCWS